MELATLDDFGRRHHGLVNRSAAARLGVSRSAWYRALDAGLLEPVFPGVARLWGAPLTLPHRALAAVWGAGPGALASHRTAAALWGVERPADDPIEVLLPARTRNVQLLGVVVHRPRDLRDLRPIIRQQVPTTSPLRMLLDLGAVDADAVEQAMVAVMSSKVASPAAIRSALFRHAKKGRHGVTALRTALGSWLGEELPPDSELETRMASFIVRHGLPPVRFHALVEGFEVDFIIVGTRVVLECDGWGVHGLHRDQFEFDRIRDAVLLAAGYTTLRFTWKQLVQQPEAVAERIRQVLRRWAPHALAATTGSRASR